MDEQPTAQPEGVPLRLDPEARSADPSGLPTAWWFEGNRGSGGAGRFHGGDGVVREIEALAPLHYSLITERRRHAPPGADGGEPGAPGRNLLDGEELEPKSIGELAEGQRLRIETPGGGGFGRAA